MSTKRKKPTAPHFDLLSLLRAFIGPSFVIGGWQLMPLSYVTGVLIVYVGFVLCLAECIWEPALIHRPYQLQVVLIGITLALACTFTIQVVGMRAPIEFYSYAMREGNYSDGADIGGITWNSHFTNLSIAVVNPDYDDYRDMDITIVPDAWAYKAAILGNNPDCKLSPIGGNTIFFTVTKGGGRKMTMHRFGERFEAEDDMGDVFRPLATDAGYRLICPKFPRRFTIKVVFALVTLNPDLLRASPPPTNLKPGEWGMTASEWSGVKSEFDMLGVRPSPSVIKVKGRYGKKVKEFSLSRTLDVKDGN